ncbi:hypothetical protein [Streptomyces sp. NPDC102360]|uniref:hypothetical protein n=1 Tax=Streptomyces sp. NPDC102360 TaxID=3366160 RepID=UPI00380D3413
MASAALVATHFSFEGDTYQHCRYLGPSTRMYVTAWAAPLCGLAAVGVLLALRRGARGRERRPGDTRPEQLATATACLVPFLLLLQLAYLYWVYAPDPAGGQDCSGLMVTRVLR